jgi:acyl-CoA thioesterase-1
MMVALAGVATGQADKPKKANPFDPIQDAPNLPRVLLIGDSISIGYTLPVREKLEGKANVHRVPTNAGPTTRGLEQLESWLREGKWDVIHFNFGLHDLKYMDEKGKLVPVDQGRQQVPVDQYAANLDKIAGRLKQTGAKVIFATTTPVPEGAVGRIPADVVKYNAAAVAVMKRHDIAIDDLYAFALPQLEKIQKPKDVHYTAKGSDMLGDEVVRHIAAALPKK